MTQKSSDKGNFILLCIDSLEDGVAAGRFYHSCLSRKRTFRSLDQFLLETDRLLDGEQLSFTAASNSNIWHTGKIATFKVNIIFRQNNSWQGSIIWLETRHEENFRSALELLSIVRQALIPAQKGRMRPSTLKIAK